jgi:hypothetical protein
VKDAGVTHVLQRLYESFGGAEGMARLRADWKQWKADHPGEPFPDICMCPCSRIGHDSDLCEDRVALLKPCGALPDRILVPMCQYCAARRGVYP